MSVPDGTVPSGTILEGFLTFLPVAPKPCDGRHVIIVRPHGHQIGGQSWNVGAKSVNISLLNQPGNGLRKRASVGGTVVLRYVLTQRGHPPTGKRSRKYAWGTLHCVRDRHHLVRFDRHESVAVLRQTLQRMLGTDKYLAALWAERIPESAGGRCALCRMQFMRMLRKRNEAGVRPQTSLCAGISNHRDQSISGAVSLKAHFGFGTSTDIKVPCAGLLLISSLAPISLALSTIPRSPSWPERTNSP